MKEKEIDKHILNNAKRQAKAEKGGELTDNDYSRVMEIYNAQLREEQEIMQQVQEELDIRKSAVDIALQGESTESQLAGTFNQKKHKEKPELPKDSKKSEDNKQYTSGQWGLGQNPLVFRTADQERRGRTPTKKRGNIQSDYEG